MADAPRLTVADQLLANALAVLVFDPVPEKGSVDLATAQMRDALRLASRDHARMAPLIETAEELVAVRAGAQLPGNLKRDRDIARQAYHAAQFAGRGRLTAFFRWRAALAADTLAERGA